MMGSMHVMPAILDDGAVKTSYTAGGGEATTNVVDNYQLLVSGVHHKHQACRCYIRFDATLCKLVCSPVLEITISQRIERGSLSTPHLADVDRDERVGVQRVAAVV